jgi:hypothetical protein
MAGNIAKGDEKIKRNTRWCEDTDIKEKSVFNALLPVRILSVAVAFKIRYSPAAVPRVADARHVRGVFFMRPV